MGLHPKPAGPVDRAVADLERQIHALERQIRACDAGRAERPAAPAQRLAQSLKELLTPPGQRRVAARRPRRDLFDVEVAPLRELEAEPVALTAKPELELFQSAGPAGGSDKKLLRYLSTGGIRTYKPLKHVQRQARNRFLMWLGVSAVALLVLYVVVR